MSGYFSEHPELLQSQELFKIVWNHSKESSKTLKSFCKNSRLFRNFLDHPETFKQFEEEYGHMGTLWKGKIYKIKEIKESYIKCAHKAA